MTGADQADIATTEISGREHRRAPILIIGDGGITAWDSFITGQGDAATRCKRRQIMSSGGGRADGCTRVSFNRSDLEYTSIVNLHFDRPEAVGRANVSECVHCGSSPRRRPGLGRGPFGGSAGFFAGSRVPHPRRGWEGDASCPGGGSNGHRVSAGAACVTSRRADRARLMDVSSAAAAEVRCHCDSQRQAVAAHAGHELRVPRGPN